MDHYVSRYPLVKLPRRCIIASRLPILGNKSRRARQIQPCHLVYSPSQAPLKDPCTIKYWAACSIVPHAINFSPSLSLRSSCILQLKRQTSGTVTVHLTMAGPPTLALRKGPFSLLLRAGAPAWPLHTSFAQPSMFNLQQPGGKFCAHARGHRIFSLISKVSLAQPYSAELQLLHDESGRRQGTCESFVGRVCAPAAAAEVQFLVVRAHASDFRPQHSYGVAICCRLFASPQHRTSEFDPLQ